MRIDGGGAAAKFFPAGWSFAAAKPCDMCKTAAALLFCRTHATFMCVACDAKVHVVVTGRHERVWMCEVCEQAPAVVTCKADAAALCVTCDHDIHSANPLARRHDRVPVVPFYHTAEAVVSSTADAFLIPAADTDKIGASVAHEESMAATTVSIPQKQQPSIHYPKSIEIMFSDPVHFLGFDYPIQSGTDSVVPVQNIKAVTPPAPMMDHSPDNCFEIDFSRSSNFNSFNNSSYTAHSLSQSVSSSSMDVGVVPDGSSMSDISYPFALQMSTGIELSASTNSISQAPQLSGMDREARVKRYKEKRKNRKFEKTIRYASRKAYAETRPRIKGRFVKRTETETNVGPEVDRWFTSESTPAFLLGNSRFGVVPSFRL